MNLRGPKSIRRKLPLLICSLLLVIGLAASGAAYFVARAAALSVSTNRLTSVTAQLSDLLSTSAGRMYRQLDSLTDGARLRRALATGPTGPHRDAQQLLDSLAHAGGQTAEAELWDAAGRRIAVGGSTLAKIDSVNVSAMLAGPGADSDRVTPLRRRSGKLVYNVIAPVRDGGRTAGFLILRRRVAGSPGSAEQLTRLIGSDARLYVGNRAGDVWTNLIDEVPPPPVVVPPAAKHAVEYTRDSIGTVLAAARRIPQTPWVVLFEFPKAAALRAPHQLALWLALVTLLVVLAGGVAAVFLSRSITRPLGELAAAAGSIAGGDLSRRVAIERSDELGDVAAAFNMMAATVQESRDRLEEQVAERTAALATVNQELEAFSYSVSHDLRAPLRSIDGFSQALLEDYHDRLDDPGRNYLNRVRAASQRMGRLIDDLLELARVTRARLSDEAVDLSAMAADIAADLRERNPNRAVELSIAPDLAARGDPRLLRVVLDNLLSNAWKFTSKSEHPRVEFGGANRDGTPTLFVRDNGVGFDMNYADKLFGPFQRLHAADEFEGTGVGLATVQRIVHRHGGRVWAEGALGRGATVWFTLPFTAAARGEVS